MSSTPTPSCETGEIKEENVDPSVEYDGILNPDVVILNVKDEILCQCEGDPDYKEEPDFKEEPDCKEEPDYYKEESGAKDDLPSGDEHDKQGTREEEILVKSESCNFPESCDCVKCEPLLDSDGEIMEVENMEPQVPITQKQVKVPKSGRPKKKKSYYPGSKVFECDNCNYKCNQLAHMEYHRSIHTGEKPLACTHCDYRTRHPTTLTRHVRSQHTGEKPYACEFCDYKAAQPGALHRHRRTHTGEKPYACKWCDYRSPDLNTVQIHELSHTGNRVPTSFDLTMRDSPTIFHAGSNF
uniref:Myeloid zinc finger 1 n=1 Tax=Lygus hesperus TaxID=30085 RepID=A0A0A9WB96_LYGHE